MLARIKQLLGISPAFSRRFSDDVRWTFGKANLIAQQAGADYLTSGHVLAAITEHPGAGAYLGVTDLDALRDDALRSSANNSAPDGLKEVLQASVSAAERDGEELASLDHIIEAMLQSPKLVAHGAMMKHGVRVRKRPPRRQVKY